MASSNSRKRTRWITYSLVCVVLVLALIIVGRGAGRWLVRQDALARADVIVVLSGSVPYRAEEAGRIFNMGDAPEVWITRPENPDADLQKFGIHYIGEEEYSRQVLLHQGVPQSAILILPEAVVNTEQEVDEVAALMRKRGDAEVIIVTSPQHTRRVAALWRKLAGHGLHAIVRAAPSDPFNADHWWHNTRDTFAVFREILGLVNVWTGLPVRPSSG